MKESPLGSPRGAGMSPGSSASMQAAESSSSETGIANLLEGAFPAQGQAAMPSTPTGIIGIPQVVF